MVTQDVSNKEEIEITTRSSSVTRDEEFLPEVVSTPKEKGPKKEPVAKEVVSTVTIKEQCICELCTCGWVIITNLHA